MKSENQSMMKYQDIDLSVHRHPVLVELEAALIAKKPLNTVVAYQYRFISLKHGP